MKKVKVTSVAESINVNLSDSILCLVNDKLRQVKLDEIYNRLYTVGFKVFPINSSAWEVGYVDQTGNNVEHGSYLRLKKLYEIKPNTGYRLNNDKKALIAVRIYDSSQSVIQTFSKAYGVDTDLSFTTNSNARYIRVYVDRLGNTPIYDYGFKIIEG